LGGAPNPYCVNEGECVVELITSGKVYNHPDGEMKSSGTVFIHQAGESTVFKSSWDSNYECLVAKLSVEEKYQCLSEFNWNSQQAAIIFSDDVLSSFHRLDMDKKLLLNYIWSTLMFQQEQYQLRKQGTTYPLIIAQALAWIEDHYREPINIDQWSNALEMSSSHFQSIFKSAVGMTPYQHLIQIRMRVAREDLVSSNEPIKRIASNLGFSNIENFCRSFKKAYDKTAAEYRKNYRMLD
jgi:AraC-like DNA-binding protein